MMKAVSHTDMNGNLQSSTSVRLEDLILENASYSISKEFNFFFGTNNNEGLIVVKGKLGNMDHNSVRFLNSRKINPNK